MSLEGGLARVEGTNGSGILGDQPILSWKLENPVDTFIEFIILKRMIGKAQTQPF